jgi:hypothetical protein
MSFLNRYVWQSRWVNTSDLSCIIFYWLEARSKSGKVLFASFFYINNKSFIYRKAQLNVVQQMYHSRILTKFYRRKNESDDQQLASVCYIILDTLMFFFFFVLTKKKKRREPRSLVMTHLSFSVPSFFFLTEQNLCKAIKEKKKFRKKRKL